MLKLLSSLAVVLSISNAAFGENDNPPILKKGETLWYGCDINSADGEWAIQHFPLHFDLYIGKMTSKVNQPGQTDVTKWKGHIAFTYRNGSVRLREAEVSQSGGFVDGDPKKGFIPYGWRAADPNGDFEYIENRNPKSGWLINHELRLSGYSGVYDCKIVEPIGLPH